MQVERRPDTWTSDRPGSRRSLLYAVAVLLLLMLVLSITGHLLQLRPAALVGFPVTIVAITSLILVLFVLAENPAGAEKTGQEKVDAAFLPALAVDPRGGAIIAANDAAGDLLGANIVQRGISFPDLIAKDACDGCRHIIQDAVDNGRVAVEGCNILNAGGGRSFCDLLAQVDKSAGEDVVIVAFRRNQGADSIAEFARVQERLMSNISHEVRTPLNVVLGFSELLCVGTLGELTEKQLDAITECHSGGQRILTLLTDILDVGRARSYSVDEEPTMLDPAEMLQRIDALLTGQARRAEIQLRFEVDDPPTILAPEILFKQLVYHLILNSIERSSPGDTVTVRVEGGDHLTMEVSDTGPMMHPPIATSSRSSGATGETAALPAVGLPLSMAIAEELGDVLRVANDGDGVHFIFRKALTEEL